MVVDVFSPGFGFLHLGAGDSVTLHHLAEAHVGRQQAEIDGSAEVDELNGGGVPTEHLLGRGCG